MKCDRCRNEVNATIVSRFNFETLCLPCEAKERKHPRYQAAVEAELAACKAGDFNYPGIGRPSDL